MSDKITAATVMDVDRKRVIMEYQVFTRQPRIAWRLWDGVLTNLVVEEGYYAAIQSGKRVTVLHPPQVCLEGICTKDHERLLIMELVRK